MILDYVSSGNSSLKIFRHNIQDTLGVEDYATVKNLLRSLETPTSNYSLLFNAYTEENLGKAIHGQFTDCIHSTHADSGGLQMITLGHKADKKEKYRIYDIQAKYSTVAMCFDEIPVTTGSAGSAVTNMGNRAFDHSLVKSKAIETAQNLKDQILRFKELGSAAKPMLIVQGNCIDSFQDWINYACDELGDLLPDVYGIAVSGASVGSGPLEGCIRAAASTILDYPKELNVQNIHLLGVGSPVKFLPFVSFKKKLENAHISYDSTTHSHAIFTGMLVDGQKSLHWDKLPISSKEHHIENINTLLSKVTDYRVTYNSICEMYAGSLEYQKKTGKLGVHCEHFVLNTIATYCYMIERNIKSVQTMFNQGSMFAGVADGRGGVGVYQALSECHNSADFRSWHASYGKYIPSEAVKSNKDVLNTLEEFF